MEGVLWADTSKEPRFQGGAVSDAERYDLVIVGGGYCGLSTALHASRLGLSVALLEASAIGCGASGRNGGYVVPALPGAKTIEDLHDAIGKARASKLATLVSEGPDYVFNQIREYNIQCDPDEVGWMQPAHSERAIVKARKAYESWRDKGLPVQWLSGQEVLERSGSPGYLGGWYCSKGGVLNPFAYAQGIAKAAAAAGAEIYEGHEVLGVTRAGSDQIVKTKRRDFRAKKVVFATNGYSPGFYPGVAQSVIPIRLFQVFTRPLTLQEQKTVMPSRIPFTDLRKSGGFGRLDASARLTSGGAVFAGNRAYGERHCAHRIAELFPQLGPIEIERYWEGYCALTDDGIPAIQRLDDNVYSAVGFSTRGVALANTLGRELAALIAESKTEEQMPVRVGGVKKIFLQPLKTILGGYAFPVYKARDGLRIT
jgi:glycine/D-amino acid oxidase-like deaminating enzyme